MIVLNLGCGGNKRSDEIGIDIQKTSATDVVCNLDASPLPFANDSVDVVRSNHCFEHIADLVGLMSEVHRILKPGGMLEVTVPHVSNIDFWRDPTHRTAFTYRTFDYFVRGMKPVSYCDAEFEYVDNDMRFGKGLRGRLGKMLFRLSPRKYEKYYTWKYPCYEIHVKLRALK